MPECTPFLPNATFEGLGAPLGHQEACSDTHPRRNMSRRQAHACALRWDSLSKTLSPAGRKCRSALPFLPNATLEGLGAPLGHHEAYSDTHPRRNMSRRQAHACALRWDSLSKTLSPAGRKCRSARLSSQTRRLKVLARLSGTMRRAPTHIPDETCRGDRRMPVPCVGTPSPKPCRLLDASAGVRSLSSQTRRLKVLARLSGTKRRTPTHIPDETCRGDRRMPVPCVGTLSLSAGRKCRSALLSSQTRRLKVLARLSGTKRRTPTHIPDETCRGDRRMVPCVGTPSPKHLLDASAGVRSLSSQTRRLKVLVRLPDARRRTLRLICVPARKYPNIMDWVLHRRKGGR